MRDRGIVLSLPINLIDLHAEDEGCANAVRLMAVSTLSIVYAAYSPVQAACVEEMTKEKVRKGHSAT